MNTARHEDGSIVGFCSECGKKNAVQHEKTCEAFHVHYRVLCRPCGNKLGFIRRAFDRAVTPVRDYF